MAIRAKNLDRLNCVVEDLLENLTELRDELRNVPKKRYVSCRYLNPREGYSTYSTYIYEDPWGDLKIGDIVERPSGICRVSDVDINAASQSCPPLPLTGRYRREPS